MSKNTAIYITGSMAPVEDFLTIWITLGLGSSTPIGSNSVKVNGAKEAALKYLKFFEDALEVGGVTEHMIYQYGVAMLGFTLTTQYATNVLAWFLMYELHCGKYN